MRSSKWLSAFSETGPILYVYVLAAAVLRILPHPWNLAPVGAMFLFSAATFRSRWQGWLVPLAALMISDYAVVQILWHGQVSWFSPANWTAFSLAGLLGWTLRSKITVPRVAGAGWAAQGAPARWLQPGARTVPGNCAGASGARPWAKPWDFPRTRRRDREAPCHRVALFQPLPRPPGRARGDRFHGRV